MRLEQTASLKSPLDIRPKTIYSIRTTVHPFLNPRPYTLNQTTQQLPSNPALDFANLVLEETNYGLELIDILHDIAQGTDEDATTHDRITASNILLDRGLGKCPKQGPVLSPSKEPVLSPVEGSERDPESAESDNPANHSSDTLRSEPESPRLVTQIDETLNQSIGPAPEVEPAKAGGGGEPALSNVEGSIHFIIQQHILDITNNGRTLFDSLAEIARAKEDPRACPEPSRRAKSSHRTRATRILIDRVLGTNTPLPMSAPDSGPAKQKPYRRPVRYLDPVKLAEARAEVQRMKDEGILTPDPNAPLIDISSYRMPEDYVLPPEVAAEEAAAFLAEVNLRLERQKQWPEVEERRRKKLAQLYPSHSEDDDVDPPET